MPRFLLALLLSLGSAAAWAQPIPNLVAAGKITWGVSPTFTPFEYVENGKEVGFDVELMDAMAAKMGLQSGLFAMEFKGLIPAMQGHRVDILVSGMYISAARLELADMIPYMVVGNQLLVRKGNPAKINAPGDVCGHRLAAALGTIYEVAARKIGTDCTAAGKPAVEILTLASTATSALALMQDRVDAMIVSTPTSAALIRERPEAYDAGGAPFDTNTKVGIALPKDSPVLKAALEKALQEVVADGSYAKLLTKYNFPTGSSLF